MGLLKTAADLVYTIRFLKLLVTPIEKTKAFEAGIIDETGKKRKDFNTNSTDDREAYRSHYTPFHRLVFNLKKIMAKAPGGTSIVARYGAALALIKEHGELKDSHIMDIHAETGIDILDVLAENSQWFVLNDKQLSPGIYRIKHDTMNGLCEDVHKNDKIRVEEDAYPFEEILGIDIYKGIHLATMSEVYFTTGELTR
jgi:hypothetical protein|tara:strand:- start:7484 stop:8077 length:594 start_codon:yes stop_codon:yes gene_type:complete